MRIRIIDTAFALLIFAWVGQVILFAQSRIGPPVTPPPVDRITDNFRFRPARESSGRLHLLLEDGTVRRIYLTAGDDASAEIGIRIRFGAENQDYTGVEQ